VAPDGSAAPSAPAEDGAAPSATLAP